LHHSLVTNCLKGRYTFFVFNEVYLSYLSNVYRTCSFFTNLELFCIDNARIIENYGNYISYTAKYMTLQSNTILIRTCDKPSSILISFVSDSF